MPDELKEMELWFEDYTKELEKQKEHRVLDEAVLRAYEIVKKDSSGRMVLWDILEFCGVFRSSFTGNSKTYFNEGQRDVGLYILKMMEIAEGLEGIEQLKDMKPEKDG